LSREVRENTLFRSKLNKANDFKLIVNLSNELPKKKGRQEKQGTKQDIIKNEGPKNIKAGEKALQQILKDTQMILMDRNRNEVESFKKEYHEKLREDKIDQILNHEKLREDKIDQILNAILSNRKI
jgi:hypothetical protein